MIAKVFFSAVLLAIAHAAPKPEPALAVTAPEVAYAAAPVVYTRTVGAPLSARIAVAPVAHVPVATSTSSQYVAHSYNGLATYAVAAPVASVVDTRARFVAAPRQVVVASAPQVVVSSPAQFVATPTSTSSQIVTRTYNGLPAVTYYTVPAFAAAPVAVGVPASPVPAAPVAPPTQSSSDVEVLDA